MVNIGREVCATVSRTLFRLLPAQERGDVGKRGDFGGVTSRGEDTPTVADLGLSHKEIHEARQIRDAEIADPGIAPAAWPKNFNFGCWGRGVRIFIIFRSFLTR